MKKIPGLRQKIDQFLEKVNRRFGFYLDCCSAFKLLHKQMVKEQAELQRELQKITGQSVQLDDSRVHSGIGPPPPALDCRTQKPRLDCRTLKQRKSDNGYHGYNYRTALEDCVCAFFNLWDSFLEHEMKIKAERRRERFDQMPIIEYLRPFRHTKTHKEFTEKKLAAKDYICSDGHTLPAFSENDAIELSEEDLYAIVFELRGSIYDTMQEEDDSSFTQQGRKEKQDTTTL